MFKKNGILVISTNPLECKYFEKTAVLIRQIKSKNYFEFKSCSGNFILNYIVQHYLVHLKTNKKLEKL